MSQNFIDILNFFTLVRIFSMLQLCAVAKTTVCSCFRTDLFCRHKNVQVRSVAAHLIQTLIENVGCERVLIELPDRILPVAAKFITDGSQQVRYAHTVTD